MGTGFQIVRMSGWTTVIAARIGRWIVPWKAATAVNPGISGTVVNPGVWNVDQTADRTVWLIVRRNGPLNDRSTTATAKAVEVVDSVTLEVVGIGGGT